MTSTDREALMALFRSTGGAGWRRRNNWDTDAGLATWDGVEVNDQGRVVGLNLARNNLQGPIPPELGNLAALETLSLRVNSLTGHIPKELGALTNLEKLSLDRNHLTGAIPVQVGALNKLTWLNLSNNQLSGAIPVQVGALNKLTWLNLSNNQLSGHIPPQLGDLGALKSLYLNHNKFDGPIPEVLGTPSKLEMLHLTGNQLTGPIPPELGKLAALESLDLADNQLAGPIPPELGRLAALQQLYVWRNQLTGPIPKDLGNLTRLEELQLYNNNLTGPIPPELGSLGALKTLDLGNNKLEGRLPPELGNLRKLKSLWLPDNQLTGHLPRQLGHLSRLEYLDLSANMLDGESGRFKQRNDVHDLTLQQHPLSLLNPFTLARLCSAACVHLCLVISIRLAALWDHTQNVQDVDHKERGDSMSGGAMPSQLCRLLGVLDSVGREGGAPKLNGNPWAEPPESIVAKGPKSIRGYFEDLYAEPCRIKRSSVKVVLVGQEGAGKTSLRQSMKANEATPTGEWKEESTVFVDVEPMELQGSSVRVYDCAGQVAYTGLLQMFLTPRSVCVLVCNAGEFGQRRGSEPFGEVQEDFHKLEELRVCDWLRSISRRVPDNDVILVATKCDLAGGNAGKIGSRMENSCRTWLSGWVGNGMQPVRLEPHVCLTSCFPIGVGEHGERSAGSHVSNGGWACDWQNVDDDQRSPSLLHRLVNKPDGRGLRGTQMVLPRSWDIALTVLEAVEHGRDPVEVVLRKSPDPDRGDATEPAEGETDVYQGITVEELGTKWQETVDALERRGITVTNTKNALEGALSIREFDGSLVRHENFVFLDVVWLARILKPLLNHKDQQTFDGRVNLGDTGDARMTLHDQSDIASWGRLKNEGVLEPRLAYAMWPDGLSEYVLPTLASLGLTFPLEGDPDDGLVVLLRLEPDCPESVGEVIDTFCSEHTPAFNASWEIFLGVPPGAIEKVLTRCCGLGGVRTFWRYGALVHGGLGDLDGRGIFAVVLEYSSTNNELTAQVFGDISTPAPWVALSYVTSAMSLMLVDFPGLRWKGSLKCPQHGNEMLFANKVNRVGDRFLERRCPHCSPETRGLGAAAIDLVRVVDIRLDREVIFREVKAMFVVLESQYFTCPAGSSKTEDEVLRKIEGMAIAMKGGFDDTEAGLRHVRDEMNCGFGMIQGSLGRIDGVATAVRGGFAEVEGGMNNLKGEMKGVKQEVKDGLGMIKGNLDKVLESTQESLMRLKELQAPNYRYPRFVVVNEVGSDGTSSNSHGKKSMLSKLRGLGKKDMTLHFLCPVDMTKVPCGYGGNGYRFQETRGWVKKISPVLQVAVVTAKVALNATTGLNVDISDFLKDVKDGLVEELIDRTLDEEALLRAVSGDNDIGGDLQRDTRASYEALKKFMDKEQIERVKNARDGDGYVDFRDKMKRVTDGRGGMVWVRNENVQQWLDSNSFAAPTS
ncbi:unnamed protein product [Ectocarpus fasciculatus]